MQTSRELTTLGMPDIPRTARNQVVLEEDDYVAVLNKIIERDFFPDLPVRFLSNVNPPNSIETSLEHRVARCSQEWRCPEDERHPEQIWESEWRKNKQ